MRRKQRPTPEAFGRKRPTRGGCRRETRHNHSPSRYGLRRVAMVAAAATSYTRSVSSKEGRQDAGHHQPRTSRVGGDLRRPRGCHRIHPRRFLLQAQCDPRRPSPKRVTSAHRRPAWRTRPWTRKNTSKDTKGSDPAEAGNPTLFEWADGRMSSTDDQRLL